jgi:hypothetical protein
LATPKAEKEPVIVTTDTVKAKEAEEPAAAPKRATINSAQMEPNVIRFLSGKNSHI